jgi:predicted metal-binding membrane protein
MTVATSTGAVVSGRPVRGVVVGLVAVVAVAWVVLLTWARSPWAAYLDHDGLEHPDVVRVALLALGWALMTLAMMLPASVPYIRTLAVTEPRRRLVVRSALLLLGFLLVWLAFGVGVTLVDLGVHRTVDAVPWVGGHAWLVFPVTLLLAAAYQLTRVKRASLELCRHPSPAAAGRWVGRGAVGAWRTGLRHGVDCVGSCAGLMLVVFALGMTTLVAMAGGAVVAVAERVVGARVVVAVAVGLAAAALLARVSG